MSEYIAPGSYFEEIDNTIEPPGDGPTGVAIVVEAPKGPIHRWVLCTSPSEYKSNFGKADNTMHYAAYMSQMSALGALRGCNRVYVRRVTNGATYGGAVLLYNDVEDTYIFTPTTPPAATDIYADNFKESLGPGFILGFYDYSPADNDIKITMELNTTTSEGGFRVRVFSPSDSTRSVESYLVSLERRLNALGEQMYIEDYINNRSKRIVVRVNDDDIDPYSGTLNDDLMVNILNPSPLSSVFDGGSPGVAVSNDGLIEAYNKFNGDKSISVDFYANAGWESITLKQTLIDLAINNNGFALIDAPVSLGHDMELIADWRNNVLGSDSSYGCVLSPYLSVTDSDNDTQVFVPPSGYIAGVAAKSDLKNDRYISFAGMKRGDLNFNGDRNDVIGVKTNYNDAAQELAIINQICPILVFAGSDPVLFGDYTLQTANSMLSYINVRRMVNLIRDKSVARLRFELFDPNSDSLRDTVKSILEKILKDIESGEGLTNPEVVCDSTNNTRETRAAGEIISDVGFVPIGSTRKIIVRATLNKEGVSFNTDI